MGESKVDVSAATDPGDSPGDHKNGRQKGRENAASLRKYVNELRAQNGRLPSHNGKPNHSAIALACGFDRQVFYDNPEVQEVLEQAVIDVGLGTEEPGGGGRAAHTQKRLDASDRRVQELEGKLVIKNAEIEELTKEKNRLEEKLRQYANFEEVMSANGRRYIP